MKHILFIASQNRRQPQSVWGANDAEVQVGETLPDRRVGVLAGSQRRGQEPGPGR